MKKKIIEVKEEMKYKEFIKIFDANFESNVAKRKAETPVFSKLFDDFIEEYKITEYIEVIEKVRKEMLEEILKGVKNDEKELLEYIEFYNKVIEEDKTQQAIIYGYLLGSELRRECLRQYPKKQ